ncbi:dehydrogenase/reductase SDR family member 7B-like [Mya arenaria]|nr:dehydrogenase/reductase SDR family member 7B-like [Mya arenaria]XP_052814655.1 dehydrogenase/reductase SDR family member 7B-like [Mya arenaria]
MQISPFAQAVGGTSCLLGLIYWLLTRRKRTSLKGKVVLITGANSGLGKALAEVFFKAGCKVILAGRNLAQLNDVMEGLKTRHSKSPSDLAILTVDLCDLQSLEGKGQEAGAIFGTVDVLINNAGVSYRGNIAETTIDVHTKVMNVNYFGQIALTKALLPMIKKTNGHIIAISSVQGRISQAYRSAYAASKHALQAYFDCLRAELWSTGVHVCVVSPGYIQTDLSLNAVCADGSKYGVMDKTTESGLPPEQVAKSVLQAIERGTPEIFPATLTQKTAIVLRAVCPRLLFYIMKKRAKKQCKEANSRHMKQS